MNPNKEQSGEIVKELHENKHNEDVSIPLE